MAYLQSILLIFFEMTFLFVALALLLQQRRTIGTAPFYVAFGFLMLFGIIFAAADLKLHFSDGMSLQLGGLLISAPLLTAFLALYIIRGVWHAQHMIIAMAAAAGISWDVFELTFLQCNWEGFEISSGFAAPTLSLLVSESWQQGKFRIVFTIIDFFVVPLVFRQLEKWKVGLFPALLLSLLSAVITQYLTHRLAGAFTGFNNELTPIELLAMALAMLWLGTLLAVFLIWLERDLKLEKAGPLDLFFAFIGSYRRAKELEADIRESEDRYHLVINNAGELIVLLTPDGVVLDLNIIAAKVLNLQADRLNGENLFERLAVVGDGEATELAERPEEMRRFQCELDPGTPGARKLSLSLSPVQIHGRLLVLMIAQDNTEELQLAQAHRELEEQLAHSQRLEALGKLAGGIAHDFNNCIHAIMGHIDLARLTADRMNPDLDRRLENVSEIAEQAGKLTSRLLGFARKGKYQIVRIDPEGLMRDCIGMLGPSVLSELECETAVTPGTPEILGDPVQLRQLVLNLLLNAIDAMRELPAEQRKLKFTISPAADAPLTFVPSLEYPDAKCEDYLAIAVSDCGCGMDEETKKRIFEPFFTTKPVGTGTGMGLAMVYGTATNHHGWVQVESARNTGSCFCVFIPGAPPRSGETDQ